MQFHIKENGLDLGRVDDGTLHIPLVSHYGNSYAHAPRLAFTRPLGRIWDDPADDRCHNLSVGDQTGAVLRTSLQVEPIDASTQLPVGTFTLNAAAVSDHTEIEDGPTVHERAEWCAAQFSYQAAGGAASIALDANNRHAARAQQVDPQYNDFHIPVGPGVRCHFGQSATIAGAGTVAAVPAGYVGAISVPVPPSGDLALLRLVLASLSADWNDPRQDIDAWQKVTATMQNQAGWQTTWACQGLLFDGWALTADPVHGFVESVRCRAKKAVRRRN